MVMSEGAAGKSRSHTSCLDRLEVPHPPAGGGAQAEDRVREQVVAVTIGAVEVVGGRPRRGVDQPSRVIEGQPRPGVGAAAVAPGVFRPGLMAGLARVGDGVERPPLPAGVDIERADVARRGGQALGHDGAEDEEVAEEHARRIHAHAQGARVASAEAPAEIDAAVLSEAADRLPRVRIEGMEPVSRGEIDPPLRAPLPVHQAADPRARRLPAGRARVEAPLQGAGGGIEREHAQPGRRRIQDPVRHDGLALHLRSGERVTGVVGPGHLQLGHVGPRDLREGGIAGLVRPAAVRPVRGRGHRGKDRRGGAAARAWRPNRDPYRAAGDRGRGTRPGGRGPCSIRRAPHGRSRGRRPPAPAPGPGPGSRGCRPHPGGNTPP